MGLNLKGLVLAFTLIGASSVRAEIDVKYLTIKKVKVHQVSKDVLNQEKIVLLSDKNIEPQGLPYKGMVNVVSAGQVIAVARELVALGEDIYRLVIKGKPSVKTNYAPISVLPKVSGEPVDILETEGWKLPTKRTYEITYTNLYGMEVVKFRYSVIYSYGGSYNGKGAYLTAAQIVPESASTLFGYDFTANMKLGGLQNHGTVASPVAGAILQMEYTVSTLVKSNSEVESYHVTGKGGFKQL